MKKLLGSLAIVFGVFAFAALASASTADVLQPASDVVYDEDLIVNGTGIFDSVKIGKQGVGGVTFFNGTMINATTDENGDPVPLTIGDDTRIDGAIHRGEEAGPGDSMPIKLNDDVTVYGDIEVKGKTTVNELEGPNGVGLPVAYGWCNADGTTRGGTANVACSWDAGDGSYAVTIDGENYDYREYVTVVTPAGSSYLISTTDSLSNNLLVIFRDRDETINTGIQSDFSFITYRLPQ